MDSQSKVDVSEWVRDRRLAQNCVTKSQLEKKIKTEFLKTGERNGIGNASTTCCSKTFTRLYKKLNSKTVKPQKKTKARVKNESDLRNSYSMIAMVWAFAEFLDPNMVYNWDATQFVVERDGNDEVVVIKGEDDDTPATVVSAGETGVAIKYIHFHNSAGDVSSAVYLVAGLAILHFFGCAPPRIISQKWRSMARFWVPCWGGACCTAGAAASQLQAGALSAAARLQTVRPRFPVAAGHAPCRRLPAARPRAGGSCSCSTC